MNNRTNNVCKIRYMFELGVFTILICDRDHMIYIISLYGVLSKTIKLCFSHPKFSYILRLNNQKVGYIQKKENCEFGF